MKTAKHSRATLYQYIIGAAAGMLLLSALGASAADLYRWTDSRGVIHYTDKPPHGVNAERVTTKRSPSLANPRQDAVEETSETAPNPDAVRCQSERERLAVLQRGGRIQMEGRDGTVRDLSEEEIQQEREFSQRAVERFCNPQPAAED